MIDSQLFKLFSDFYKEYPILVTCIIVVSVISHTIDTIFIPILLAEIFTSMDDKVKLKNNVIYFLILFVFNKGFDLLAIFLDGFIEPYLTNFLTREFARAVFTKHDADNKPIEVAIVMDKIKSVRAALENFLSYMVSTFVPIIITLFAATIRLISVSYKIASLVFFFLLILGVIIRYLPQPEATVKYRDEVSIKMEDLFQNIDFVTSTQFGDKQAQEEIARVRTNLKNQRLEFHETVSFNQSITYMLAGFFYVVSILFLFKLYKNDEISVKQFESSIFTIGKMFEMIFTVARYMPEFVGDYQTLKVLEDFTSKLFSYQTKVVPDITMSLENGDIEFNNVSFTYNDTNHMILDNFSIKINSGDIVCLFGRSGSGKSSFTRLIMDIYQPQNGDIKIGGQLITDLSKQNIKRHVSYIAQNTSSLLQMTIYENITYGFEPSEELRKRVENIVKDYNLYTVFDDNFLDLDVEKAGSTLSGGQKQLIHLIHAMINDDAKIIILDEPTSALDTVTRDHVYNIIDSLEIKGKTILIITHDEDLRCRCRKVLCFNQHENPKWHERE